MTRGQFRKFRDATKYKTDAEKSEKGGTGYNPANAECTQSPGKDFNAWNTGFEQTDDHPVVNVSWDDAVAFCDWLSRQEGKHYRLPTEAEWEYACRGGNGGQFSHGNNPEGLAGIANVFDDTAGQTFPSLRTILACDGFVFTAPVGSFKPNGFGLWRYAWKCVQEWCADWYGEKYYEQSPAEDPQGPPTGDSRVIRGGGWCYDVVFCRSSTRSVDVPNCARVDYGFRVVRQE